MMAANQVFDDQGQPIQKDDRCFSTTGDGDFIGGIIDEVYISENGEDEGSTFKILYDDGSSFTVNWMEFLTEAEFADRYGAVPLKFQWNAAGAYLKKLQQGELSERKQRQLPALIHFLEIRIQSLADRVALNNVFGDQFTRRKSMQNLLEELKRQVLPYYFEYRMGESGYGDLPRRQNDASTEEWVTALSMVSDVPSCVFYFLQSYPALLERQRGVRQDSDMAEQQMPPAKKRRVES